MNKRFRIFLQLLRHELHIFRLVFVSKFIDTACLASTNVLVFAYFMPKLGLAGDFGEFIFIGAFASFGFFDVVVRTTDLLSDVTGDRSVAHTLTIPIPSWASIAAIPIGWGVTTMIISLTIIPVGKLILPTQLSFANVSLLRFVPIFIVTNLFYGFFGLWIAGVIPTMERVGTIWCRIIVPLWMFGAYFFTWQVVYDLSPYIGYAFCIDPFTFIMEGMRSATLGPEGYIPYWISFCALSAFTFFFAFDGVRRMKNRLDCV